MKKHLKLIYILFTILVLTNCTAKDNQINNPKQKEVVVAKTKTPAELAEEIRYKKRDELAEKYDNFEKRTPSYSKLSEIKDKKVQVMYYNWKFYYTNLESCEKEGDLYKCKQKIEISPKKVLEYDIIYGTDVIWKYDENDAIYYCTTFEKGKDDINEIFYSPNIFLKSKLNIGKVNKEIIEKQVHGEIYSLKEDPKKEEMVKLFEAYETEKYPDKRVGKYYDFRVLDYVKGNFTNSGYDEYIVMIGKDYIPYGENDRSVWIERVRCCIVDNGKVIEDYDLSEIYCAYIPEFSSSLKEGPTPEGVDALKNFGYLFSQGWVNDFNQNGINEIYFSFFRGFGGDLLVAEFTGKDFDINYASNIDSGMYPLLSADWETKTLSFWEPTGNDYAYYFPKEKHIYRNSSFQWYDDIKEFVMKEIKYEYKSRE